MDIELLPLVRELCYIASKRNEINTRRHRARFRKNYYEHAIRVIEAHAGSNSETRHIDCELKWLSRAKDADSMDESLALNKRRDHQLKMMESLRKRHPKPKKWKAMGLYKLRSLSLQGAGDYALAKHETMEFTLRTTDRVKEILSKFDGMLHYDNGSIDIIIVNASKPNSSDDAIDYRHKEIKQYAKEYELNLVVNDMLQE